MPSYSDGTPRPVRECPDCVATRTVPVRTIGGKRVRCSEHQEQYHRYGKREYARKKAAQRRSEELPPPDPYEPTRLLANRSMRVNVDPLWAQDVDLRLERATVVQGKASRALTERVTQESLRNTVRELLLSMGELTAVLQVLDSAVDAPD